MGNYFLDNEDIQFLFEHMDLAQVATAQEDGFRAAAEGDAQAPVDAQDAIDFYRRLLELVGEIAAEQVAPRATAIDREGNQLNPDGTVTLHPAMRANLEDLARADLMGFTLPRKYGGLYCPNLVYTMATEMISRADASLMNLFGLQGIAETIEAFAEQGIKEEFLPGFATGEYGGAMALTEPDAGSDLQAVSLRAWQDETGQWRLRGVKRFITNGCGEVLLTLARSEPDVKDGRGLSLFLVERQERLRVRHLERKLGIRGSPTCELVYDDVPARLIGERQRGLMTYVIRLMNGARVGIATQSLGIAEAAFRVARDFARARQQFAQPIKRIPAVAELLWDMQVALEGSRALVYETSRVCDLENSTLRLLELGIRPLEGDEKRQLRQASRAYKRLAGMLTPLSKYHASEMCLRVTSDAIQVMGGSGYMEDYPLERHLRDARITTIYEGTSQLQVVAAVRGVCSGGFQKEVEDLEARLPSTAGDGELGQLRDHLAEARDQVLQGVEQVKATGGDTMDLVGRPLIDAANAVIIGYLLLGQAVASERKLPVARRHITRSLPTVRRDLEWVRAADRSALEHVT